MKTMSTEKNELKKKTIKTLKGKEALKEVLELESFDTVILKNVLDKVIVKPDGTEEYIWKEMGIV